MARRDRMQRVAPLTALLLALAATGALGATNPVLLADTTIPRLETLLLDNVAEFWLTKAIDHAQGGYLIDFDIAGRPGPGVTKMIVTQARTVWLFARLARAGYAPDRYLPAATHGYRFLRDRMWDAEDGGFFWEVDATGTPQRTAKHLYGQAFALYALSEYYLATRDPNALDLAQRTFNLLEEKAHDPNHAGYRELFNRDWSVPPETTTGPLGAPATAKLMNTHLHLLEALTTFYEASDLPRARERLLELILIESRTVPLPTLCAATDRFAADWTRRLDGDFARVSYGHDIENVWLLIRACRTAGLGPDMLAEFHRCAFDSAWRHGYDAEHGGFYDSGRINQPADRRGKTWWVQAEALVSALSLYERLGGELYLEVFQQTLDFVEQHVADWEHGEWYASVAADGSAPSGSKGSVWKAGYHNGRALLECIAILRSLKARALASRSRR